MSVDAGIQTIHLGRSVPYATALGLQRNRRDAVEAHTAAEAMFLLEHAPVITMGRNASASNVLQSAAVLSRLGIEVAETDRGGDVTYHGPGQLVAYPILHLERRGLGIRRYLRVLEQAIVDAVATFGIAAGRMEGFTGVWVGGAKVAAIGIAVHRGVSYHGIAINVDPDMSHWQLIVPCGIADKPVTSLAALLGRAPRMAEVERAFTDALFRALHDAQVTPAQ